MSKSRMRLRIADFTGGLNEQDRSDLIELNELVRCDNYYVTKAGSLSRRACLDTLEDTIDSNISDIMSKIWAWKSPFLPDGATDERDFVLLVYTTGSELWMLHYEGISTGWVSSASDDSYIFEELSEPTIVHTDDGVAIVDGRDNHIAKYIKIRYDGRVMFGDIGLPAPLGIASVSEDDDDNAYVETDSIDKGMTIARGSILYMCYTMETEEGVESNPSPMVCCTNLNYLYKDEDFDLDQYWQTAQFEELRTVMADKDVASGLLDQVKFFNVYMGSCPYVEGTTPRGEMKLAKQIPVSALTGDNEYVATDPFVGDGASWENDVACKGDDACYTGSVLFISNANTKIGFPFEFDYFFKIGLTNSNSRNYANGAIWIRLYDSDLVDEDGNAIIEWDDAGVSSGNTILAAMLPKIRFFDDDLTTMLPTCYYYTDGNAYLDVLIKVPYIEANLTHDIYLCFDGDGIPEQAGDYTDFRTAKYGKWIDIRADWASQVVLYPNRVRSENTLVSCSNEDHETDSVPNRANGNTDGEFINSTSWVTLSLEYINVLGISKLLAFSSTDNKNAIECDGYDTRVVFEELTTTILNMATFSFFYQTPYVYGSSGSPSDTVYATADGGAGDKVMVKADIDATNINFSITAYINSTNYDTSATPTVSSNPNGVFFILMTWENDTYNLHVYDITAGAFLTTNTLTAEEITDSDDWELRAAGYNNSSEFDKNNYSQIQFEKDTFIASEEDVLQFMNFSPYFPEEHIGYHEDDDENKNISVAAGKPIAFDLRTGILKYSSLGGVSFPDGNYLPTKGENVRILPAPSYLKNGSYLNCVVVFGENFRQRVLLSGGPDGWQANINEILMDERIHYGLPKNCKNTLLMVGDSLYWLSGDKFLREDGTGVKVLNYKNGVETVNIPYSDGNIYLAWYNAIDNQIILHTQYEMVSSGTGAVRSAV